MGRIEIESLMKRFDSGDDQVVAVDDLNLTVRDGEFLVLVGPSGCGKSTTLRLIAGLERVTEGTIRLDGTEVTDQKPKDRNMAMVFQNYALYPHMTARENMGFGLKMTTDMSKEEINERVEEVAEMTGIEDLLGSKPGEMSGGQQQRVALGRAIVRDPEVFLMDEPLSNLDAKLRSEMRTELQNLQQDFDVTTIYVTHDQTEAMTMGDRIAILNDGQLQQVGTPLECYHEPANRFVASFIGSPSMNFLEVRLRGDIFEHEEFKYRLSSPFDEDDGDYALGIRPEDIEVTDGDEANAIEATVNVVEPLGDISHVYVEIGDQQYTASLAGNTQYAPGDTIWLMFPEDRIHVFDTDDGRALRSSSVDVERPAADASV